MNTSLAQFLPVKLAVKALRFKMTVSNAIRYGDPNFFQQAFIEINTHCNRSCVYCPNVSAPSAEAFMTAEAFDKVLDRLKEINWKGPVGYHYLSEPTLHPLLEQFIRRTVEVLPKSVPVMFSNGDFMTHELAARLIKAGMRRCSITQHPPLKEGWLERMEYLYHSWPEVFRVRKLPADVIKQLGGFTSVKAKMEPYCASPRLSLNIRLNGDYGLCCCDAGNKHNFGNVNTIGIMEAWNRSAWKSVRQRLLQGHRDFDICKACSGVI